MLKKDARRRSAKLEKLRKRKRKLRCEGLEDRRLLAVLVAESFELAAATGDSGLVSPGATFHDGENDYWTRTNGSSPAIETAAAGANPSYNGQDGSFYFAGEDQDDGGGDGIDEKFLSLDGINIAGHNNLEFTGLFAADGYWEDAGFPAGRYDPDDFLTVEYKIDGGVFVKALEFRAGPPTNGSSANNEILLVDTDFDGVGDGAQIVPAFNEYGFSIPGIGTTLDIRISTHFDSSDEEIAFDNLIVEGDPVVSNQAPTASPISIPDVGEANIGDTSYDLTISYADNSAIDFSTIDNGDITVTGPGGPVTITGVAVDVNSDGSPREATYSLTPPGGSWDAGDNGNYMVNVNAGEVGDDGAPALFVAAGNLGSFNVNAVNADPSVSGGTILDVIASDDGTADHSFTIEYSDGGLIDASSIGPGDITVTGPGGPLTVTGAVASGGDASPLLATYTVAAPGGTWDPADDGTYIISLKAGEVLDNAGAAVPAGAAGAFAADSTLLLQESFEAGSTADLSGDSGLVTAPDAFHNSAGDFWIRTNGVDPAIATAEESPGAPSYNGQDNHFYWAGEDLDDTGASSDGVLPGGDASATKLLSVSGIDISNRENLAFTGLFAADGFNNSMHSYDPGEGLAVEYRVDGGAWGLALAFRAGTVNNMMLSQDTDFNGVGDGTQLVETFAEFGFAIPTTGTTLDLRLTANLNASHEEIAFDLLEVTGDAVAGNAAPAINNVNAGDVGEPGFGATSYDFTVTYTDDVAIDVSTIDLGDVTVMGPGGPLTVTGASADVGSDGTPRVVTYSVTPPGGSWDAADNGSYMIGVVGGQVSDTDGTPLSVAADTNIGSFTVNAVNTPPVAAETIALDVGAAQMGDTSYSFTVEYRDVGGIDVSTIDVNDVFVEPPGVPGLVVTNAVVDNATDGSPRTVTYTIEPPGGSWDPAHIGKYDIVLHGGSVLDVNGAAIAGGLLDSFDVIPNAVLIESFENPTPNGDSSLVSVDFPFHNSDEDYWIRTNGQVPVLDVGDSPVGMPSYAGQNGAYYWVGEDLNDTGAGSDGELPGGDGSETKTLEIVGIDISGRNNLKFQGLFAADGTAGGTDRFDAGEGIEVEYSIDGGAFASLLSFQAATASSSAPLQQDTNGDGVGDGAKLTPTFDSFMESIGGTGSSLTLRVTAVLNQGDEELAFDHFVVTGDPVATEVNLSVSANAGSEAAGTAITITATADVAVAGNQNVDVDISGLGITSTDYIVPATITILDGETVGTATLTISDDILVETTETLGVSLSNPSPGILIGASNSESITITDNDTATFTIEDVSANENAGMLDLVLSLDNPVSADLSVNVLFGGGNASGGGVDYGSTTQTFNFPMIGTGSQAVSVPITNDVFSEMDETFQASISVNTAIGDADVVFTDTATGTILDDDGPAQLTVTIVAASISEGDGAGATTATVSRNTDPASALIVNLSSNDTSEATVTASITIAAGQSTSAPFNIDAFDDAIADGTQTVTITATAAGHADGTDMVDVTDDESPVFPIPTGIEVHDGAVHRSFVSGVDIAFADSAGLQDIIDNVGFRIERFGINSPPATPGTGALIPPPIASVNGNIIEVDFGPDGIGGVGAAGDGFYRIELDTDNDGQYDDGSFAFFRLWGDANGDGVVSSTDARTRVDMTGDGRFNIIDRLAARNNLGASVDAALLAMIDD